MNLSLIRTFAWAIVCIVSLLTRSTSPASAQGKFPITEADIAIMQPIHYYLEDKKYREPRFAWDFTNETFTLRKGTEPIPEPLLNQFVVKGMSADKITGKWKLVEQTLVLSKIAIDGTDVDKVVKFELYKTAPTVIRWGSLPQFVFAAEPLSRKP